MARRHESLSLSVFAMLTLCLVCVAGCSSTAPGGTSGTSTKPSEPIEKQDASPHADANDPVPESIYRRWREDHSYYARIDGGGKTTAITRSSKSSTPPSILVLEVHAGRFPKNGRPRPMWRVFWARTDSRDIPTPAPIPGSMFLTGGSL